MWCGLLGYGDGGERDDNTRVILIRGCDACEDGDVGDEDEDGNIDSDDDNDDNLDDGDDNDDSVNDSDEEVVRRFFLPNIDTGINDDDDIRVSAIVNI